MITINKSKDHFWIGIGLKFWKINLFWTGTFGVLFSPRDWEFDISSYKENDYFIITISFLIFTYGFEWNENRY